MSAEIRVNEESWTIRRQPAIAIATRRDGEYFPSAPESGLWLLSDKNERLFVPIPADRLPTEAELNHVSLGQFIEWLKQGRQGKEASGGGDS